MHEWLFVMRCRPTKKIATTHFSPFYDFFPFWKSDDLANDEMLVNKTENENKN